MDGPPWPPKPNIRAASVFLRLQGTSCSFVAATTAPRPPHIALATSSGRIELVVPLSRSAATLKLGSESRRVPASSLIETDVSVTR